MIITAFIIDCEEMYFLQKGRKVLVKDEPYNPIGYTRVTYNTKWKPPAVLYKNWKLWVMKAFIDQVKSEPKDLFTPKTQYHVFVKSFYNTGIRKTFADSDNVAKGIVDIVFDKKIIKYGDQFVASDNNYFYTQETPRVEVIITDDDNDTCEKVYSWLKRINTFSNLDSMYGLNDHSGV